MKIAISTDGEMVSAHFGRCPEYTLISLDGSTVKEKEIVSNPGHEPGRIPEYLNNKGVKVIIAGGMGPRAHELFKGYGIKTVIGVSGNVEDVINQYINNEDISGPSTCTEGGGRGYGISKTVCDH